MFIEYIHSIFDLLEGQERSENHMVNIISHVKKTVNDSHLQKNVNIYEL